MSDRAFLDTNVLIYAFAQDDGRGAIAEELVQRGGIVSVQVLNEFASVARRKMGMSWDELIDALAVIRTLCSEPMPITSSIHDTAVALARDHDYQIYDATIIASALDAQCSVLYSEDRQDGRTFEGRLTVRNPF